ncbi:MAG: hypothetical protein GX852_01070 [Clostridiales bacterium]|jgi:hypothetical protein|nr:hypothetical protein [Clostridiales bacterium]
MAEYQIRTIDCYIIPKQVYYICLWTVRDWERCKNIMLNPQGEKVNMTAEYICRCLDKAILTVPKEYRDGIISQIVSRGKDCADVAHENTWKRWKQAFLYELAAELGLV